MPWELTRASLLVASGHGGVWLFGQNNAGNSGNLTRGSCCSGGGKNVAWRWLLPRELGRR
jgi:hypothetical protein